jgi:tetratricopeptide (TPR) repeat protein
MGSGLFAGCVYNTLYNAEALYREAEDLRLAGQDSALSERYREVVAKATKGYESDEDGGRADDALLLMAKAQLRLGAIAEAKQTLERVLEISDDPDLRRQAALYRGVAAVAAGEMMRGIELLDEAIAAIDEPNDRAEGHLWRARARLQQGMAGQGWQDLDRVGEANSGFVVQAGLERVAWGFALSDLTRINQGIEALLLTSRAEVFGDSIRSLVRRFADRWGAGSAVVLLDGTEDAHWSREERNRLVMTRAWLSHEAGDTTRAKQDARRVGSGVGEQASDARVTLARWTLAEAENVSDLAALRSVLLPAVTSEEARMLLDAIRRVELLAEYGFDGEPVALIAAAEISRDGLAARLLAAALFQAYAEAVPDARWCAKALLAARDLATDPAARQKLDERLDRSPGDPYVRYARKGHDVPELGELEYRLQAELDPIIERVDQQLTARRQLAGASAGGPGE